MCRLSYIRIFVYTSLELETALLLIKDCMVWRSLTKINANNPIANNTLTTNCCKFLTYPINHQSSRQIVEPAIITVLKSLKLKKKEESVNNSLWNLFKKTPQYNILNTMLMMLLNIKPSIDSLSFSIRSQELSRKIPEKAIIKYECFKIWSPVATLWKKASKIPLSDKNGM